MTNEKQFPKTISQWEFDYGLFTNLPRIIVACDFPQSSFKLRRGILPLLAKKVSYLKTTCHIKLKFFLWTKLLEDLLFARYLISVAVPLNDFEVLIVFKLLELSRSCSKRIINTFQLSQLMFRLAMESFETFIWKVFKKILFIKSILFRKKNKKQN